MSGPLYQKVLRPSKSRAIAAQFGGGGAGQWRRCWAVTAVRRGGSGAVATVRRGGGGAARWRRCGAMAAVRRGDNAAVGSTALARWQPAASDAPHRLPTDAERQTTGSAAHPL
ncbi:hypothetical protein [Lacticaseibacillus parakribbianus]|uniref:hypothetical protein n=1 Tax=Lacticaseibacillus parakribbianus TaxID=2970927 RepID=UPI0021CB872D|nr:hypothetical protein [Lacticaseibacillus parakribbianus]